MVLVKPQSQPVLRLSTGGLRADFDKKKLRDTQVHFIILEKRTCTFSVSKHSNCWTCTTITTVSSQDDSRGEKMK